MYDIPLHRARSFKWAAHFACLLVMALPIAQARAANPLGLYVGGAVGEARVDATVPDVSGFRDNHSAFKVMIGLRPIPLIGAEIAYADFGHPSHLDGFLSTNVTMKGAMAFGILYLPLPIVDIYAKAGLARLQSTATTLFVCPSTGPCPDIATPAPVSRTNVGFAGGAGIQFKVSALTMRGEYEQFNAAGGNQGLLSFCLLWVF